MDVTGLTGRASAVAAGLALLGALYLKPAYADDQPMVMKISIPTINDILHDYAKRLGARIEKDSAGRIKAEVYPASQLGSIPRQIEGAQFGSIQCAIEPPEYFVGIDERFEILASPGLVYSMPNAQRVANDPEVRKLMFSLGANKGLHGNGLFVALPSSLITKVPLRHLDDFKGKKIRILASEFQQKAFERLGVNPVAMTLGDVLPAIQQGAIDGSIAGITVFTSMHYVDAAKYVTETGQPYIFLIAEFSRKWFDALPKDLQAIVDKAADEESRTTTAAAPDWLENARKAWTSSGGELINLPPDEQAAMLKTLADVAEDVSSQKPELAAAYKNVSEVAKRTR